MTGPRAGGGGTSLGRADDRRTDEFGQEDPEWEYWNEEGDLDYWYAQDPIGGATETETDTVLVDSGSPIEYPDAESGNELFDDNNINADPGDLTDSSAPPADTGHVVHPALFDLPDSRTDNNSLVAASAASLPADPEDWTTGTVRELSGIPGYDPPTDDAGDPQPSVGIAMWAVDPILALDSRQGSEGLLSSSRRSETSPGRPPEGVGLGLETIDGLAVPRGDVDLPVQEEG